MKNQCLLSLFATLVLIAALVIPSGGLREVSAAEVACPPTCPYRAFLPVARRSPPLQFVTVSFEATQGAQLPDNSVPLTARRRTWVRVVLTNTSTVNNVSAYLHAYGSNGAELVGSPIAAANNPRNLSTIADRANLNTTFNFLLPGEWTSVGSIRLQLRATNNANYLAQSQSQFITFTTVPTLHIGVVPIAYTCTSGGSGTTTPSAPYNYLLDNFTFKVYPVPTATLTVKPPQPYQGPCANGKPNPELEDWDNMLSQITNRWFADGRPNQYYYGLVNIDCKNGCIAGIGWVGFIKAAVGIGAGTRGAQAASEVHAHELGHNFGLRHAPGCGASDPDPSFPYIDTQGSGVIGSPISPNFGFDVMNPRIYTFYRAGGGYFDVMSYCEPQWISDYHYKKLRNRLLSSSFALDTLATGQTLVVSGRLDENDTAQLNPAFTMHTTQSTPESGNYTLELLDASGQVLASHAFEPVEAHPYTRWHEGEPVGHLRGFALAVPAQEGTRGLRVRRGEAVLAERFGGSAAPAFGLAALSEPGTQPLALSWTASDTDADTVYYTVRRSTDNGQTWETLAYAITDTSLVLSELIDGSIYEILASDGVNTSVLRIPSQPPVQP